ncbi:MAG: outer membrane beta-barrel protein [Aquisalimonadaceae bacterium]
MTSVAVQAQDYLTPQFRSFSQSGLAGGYQSDEFGDRDRRYSDEQGPWRVSGGVQLSPFVSLELGYQNFGRPTDSQAMMDTTGWSLSGMLSLPLDSGIAPYARLGQVFWGSDRSVGNLSEAPAGPDGGRDLYYGLGLRYGLAEQLNLHFEYERISQDETDFDMGSMNLRLSF